MTACVEDMDGWAFKLDSPCRSKQAPRAIVCESDVSSSRRGHVAGNGLDILLGRTFALGLLVWIRRGLKQAVPARQEAARSGRDGLGDATG